MKEFITDAQSAVKLSHISAIVWKGDGYLIFLSSGDTCRVSSQLGRKILAKLS